MKDRVPGVTSVVQPGEDAELGTNDARWLRALGVTEGRVIRAEWLKLRTVRSNLIALAAAVVVVGAIVYSKKAGDKAAAALETV